MASPRIGFGLPIYGPYAGPESIMTVASAVERLGFHSVSVSERLLLPATPGWENVYGLPEYPAYDALESLSWVAAITRRVRLGAGVVDALFQPPIVLARRLATLDHLSGGRLDAGIGQGWMPEEFAAVGVPISRRGAGFEEYIAAMRACWAPDPVEHTGPHYPILRSRIGPKPVNGHLPLFIGAGSQAAVERAARLGDGFIGALWDWDVTRTEIGWYRGAGGTGPVLLRVNPGPIEHGGDGLNAVVTAMLDALGRAAEVGVDEVHWDLTLAGIDTERHVEVLEALAARVNA